MELSWLTRLRIAAVLALGVGLIGILAWPLAAPPDPFGPVSITVGSITVGRAVVLLLLAFFIGFVAYFLSWPLGREIGTLGVPAGLSVWAIRSGSMANLIQLSPALSQRQALFSALKWESIFWLAVVAVGFLGVMVGWRIRPSPKPAEDPKPAEGPKNPSSKLDRYLSVIIALVGSVLIAQFCIRLLAQDVRMSDSKLGSVVGQPAIGQLVFAVLVSFGVAAFVFKKFLDCSYIWPIIASAFVTAFVSTIYLKQNVLEHLVQYCPAVFFPNAVFSILPVQMVAFGTLGSIAGYWLAVRYTFWRQHQGA
jgi:hypothetical protein